MYLKRVFTHEQMEQRSVSSWASVLCLFCTSDLFILTPQPTRGEASVFTGLLFFMHYSPECKWKKWYSKGLVETVARFFFSVKSVSKYCIPVSPAHVFPHPTPTHSDEWSDGLTEKRWRVNKVGTSVLLILSLTWHLLVLFFYFD